MYSARRLYDDPQYGRKVEAGTYEGFLHAIQAHYGPGNEVHVEGSTGNYRTVWKGDEVIGTAWANRKGVWFYRLKEGM